YFAMSLPIIWWRPFRGEFRWSAAVVVWCALILTFSRGAASALGIVCILKVAQVRQKPEEMRIASGLLIAGIGAVIITALFSPYLIDVLVRAPAENPPAAEYGTPWNHLREQPGVWDSVQ